MATLTNTKIKDTYDGLLKTTDNEALDASGVTLIEDGLGNASALSVGRSGNGVTVTGNLVLNGGQISLFLSDGLTQVGKFYDDSGFVVEGKVNNNLILRTKANSSGEGIKFQDSSSNDLMFIDGLNGRVGIGTSSPDTLIEASSAVGTSSSLLKLRNSSAAAANNVGLIDFEFDNSFSGQNVDVQIGAIKTNSGNEESAFIVKTTSGTGTPTERMRITSAGNVGIGNSIPSSFVVNANQLVVGSGSTSQGMTIYSNFTGTGNIFFADGTAGDTAYRGILRYDHNSDALVYFTAATERLRIDSSGNIRVKGTNTKLAWERASDGAADIVYLTKKEDISSNGNARLQGYDGIVFSTAGTETERMRIDSSGNVGIGVVPSANAGNLQIGGSAQSSLFTQQGTDTVRAGVRAAGRTGIVFDSTDSTYTNRMWYIDNVGSSGKLIIGRNGLDVATFDNSGNVGIGTNTITTAGGSYKGMQIKGSSGASLVLSNTSHDNYIYTGSTTGDFSIEASSEFRVRANGAERLRITSAGNVGIANSNPVTRLDIDGFITLRNAPYPSPTSGVLKDGFIGSDDGTLKFAINGASNAAYGSMAFITRKADSSDPIEAMRITSGGLVNIGDAASTGVGRVNISANPSNNYQIEFFTSAGTSVGSITTSGGTTTNYNTSSDYRLKEDLQPITTPLDRVDLLNPVNFAWKTDGSRVDGFIAHELQEVIPEAVTGEKDAVDEEGNPIYQGIDQSKIVPLLVGAIKELRAEIELLKSQING